jgi:hypothetical protein
LIGKRRARIQSTEKKGLSPALFPGSEKAFEMIA